MRTLAIEYRTQKEASGYICPFTPYVQTTQRSFNCIGEYCMMWIKNKEGTKGHCGLVKNMRGGD